ncbi:unannotated protein [freshwater metagenome]|uniref:Unannotated protein n=1 Tax=freshwater metagenome TaxID=449393 RepID=A0A6J7I725_9ZZZZ
MKTRFGLASRVPLGSDFRPAGLGHGSDDALRDGACTARPADPGRQGALPCGDAFDHWSRRQSRVVLEERLHTQRRLFAHCRAASRHGSLRRVSSQRFLGLSGAPLVCGRCPVGIPHARPGRFHRCRVHEWTADVWLWAIPGDHGCYDHVGAVGSGWSGRAISSSTTSGLSLNWLAVQCGGTHWALSMMSATVVFQINGVELWFQWLVKRWIASSSSATLVRVPRRSRRDSRGRDSRVSSGACRVGRGSPG